MTSMTKKSLSDLSNYKLKNHDELLLMTPLANKTKQTYYDQELSSVPFQYLV